MQRKRFEERVKVTHGDFNALHEFTEAGVEEILSALSGGLTEILFDVAPLTVTHVPAVKITIGVPQQRFSVSGVVGLAGPGSYDYPDDTTKNYKAFFVVGRTAINEMRDRLIIAGMNLSVVSAMLTVADAPAPRIEITSAVNPNVAPAPTLLPDDVGYVELGSVAYAGGAWVATHNVAAVYSFPGLGPSYVNHAPRHLPSGDDRIPLADIAGNPGLMPPNAYSVLVEAIQDLIGSPSSPFLTRVVTGDNTPGSPKRAEIILRFTDSFESVDDLGVDRLALSFMTGGYFGTSARPARADHRHSPEQSPVDVLTSKISGAAPNTLSGEIEFTSLARVLQTQVFWGPEPDVGILIPCDSYIENAALGMVGANAIIIGTRKVRVQTLPRALCRISQSMMPLLGPVTWTSSVAAEFPTSGNLYVRVVGIR